MTRAALCALLCLTACTEAKAPVRPCPSEAEIVRIETECRARVVTECGLEVKDDGSCAAGEECKRKIRSWQDCQ